MYLYIRLSIYTGICEFYDQNRTRQMFSSTHNSNMQFDNDLLLQILQSYIREIDMSPVNRKTSKSYANF